MARSRQADSPTRFEGIAQPKAQDSEPPGEPTTPVFLPTVNDVDVLTRAIIFVNGYKIARLARELSEIRDRMKEVAKTNPPPANGDNADAGAT